MKLLFISLVASLYVAGSLGTNNKCSIEHDNISEPWTDMTKECVRKLKAQVKIEVEAAVTYLAMGAHFAQDKINRLGFSKFFFEAASEEREHAIKIIEYLQMRGDSMLDIHNFLSFPLKPKEIRNWTNGSDALREALKLEVSVTNKLREIIKKCESEKERNDYHLVDYLSGDFLDEQYKGQRDLAGKIITLAKMVKKEKMFGEFLFDKKLLYGEV